MTARSTWLIGAAALLPVLATIPAAALGEPTPLAANGRFTPPSQPLLLTRTVWRTMHGGEQIIARRSYAVQFHDTATGYRVEGRQVSSTVDAPAQLAALARLEQNRIDTAGFPLLLDASGLIIAEAGAAAPRDHAAAADALQELLGGSEIDAGSKEQANRFIQQIIRTGAAAPWPRDLFHPSRQTRREQRAVALGDGTSGLVTVVISAHGIDPDSVPASVERTVTTALGGTERTTREEWTLAPI